MQIVKHWMSLLPECSLGHGNREKNQAADILSNQLKKKDILSQKCFDHTELLSIMSYSAGWFL